MAEQDIIVSLGVSVDQNSLNSGLSSMESSVRAAAQRASAAAQISPKFDTSSLESLSRPLGRVTGQADEFTKSMEAANARVIAFGASVGVLRGIMQAFREIVSVSIEVEDSLNQIAAASSSIDTKNLKELSSGIFDISKQIGVSFKEVSTAALEFSRQGKSLEETLNSTRAALVLVRTTGIDAATAVRGLTAAVNAFSEEGLTYEQVVNKMAAVDTKFAVSSRDLIEGISRSASVAQEAGVSFDELTGLITALQEKTARGGPVIGNALKTIFTRLSSNNNLTFLRDLGIELYDLEGRVLPAVNVITQLSQKLEGLEGNLKKATLVKLGGGFQVDKFAALIKDIGDIQNGKFAKAADASANAGANAFDRIEKLNISTKYSFDQAAASASQLASILGSIQFTNSFKATLDKITFVSEKLNTILIGNAKETDPDKQNASTKVAKGVVAGVTDIITGPGAALAGLVFAKILKDLTVFVGSSVKSLIGADTASKQNEAIQKSIVGVLSNNLSLQKELFSEETSRADQLARLTGIYNSHITQLQKIKDISRDLAPDIIGLGYAVDQKQGLVRKPSAKTAAEGYLSPSVAYAMEKKNTPPGHKVVRDPNFPIGGGRTVDMFYNTSETRKTNIYGSGSDAIIPNYANLDETVRQAKNKLLSEAGLPTLPPKGSGSSGGGQKSRKGGVSLNVDARQAGIAALTMAARPEGGFINRRQGMFSADTQKALEKFSPSQRAFLEQFDAISLDNLPVGYLYNRLGKANQKEKEFKQSFKTRLNAAINPAILNFSQEELIKNAGIKIEPELLQSLKNQSSSLNFVDDTAAGVIYEGMVRLPLANSENSIKAFSNRGADEFFDLFNLSPELAERYNLPRQSFPYVEVKSDLKKVQEHIIGKFLGQAAKDGRLQSLLGLQNSVGESLINAESTSEKPIFSIADKDRSPESKAAREDLKKSYPEIFNKLVSSGAISAFSGFDPVEMAGYGFVASASGFMPDSAKAIQKAWEKEKLESGLPDSYLSVVHDKSLQTSRNPLGAAVINKRDEPDGKIPNFADPRANVQTIPIEVKVNELLTKLNNLIVNQGVKAGKAESQIAPDVAKLTERKGGEYVGSVSAEALQDRITAFRDALSEAEDATTVLAKFLMEVPETAKKSAAPASPSTATQTVQAQAINSAIAADEGSVEEAKAAAPTLAKRNRRTREQIEADKLATAEAQRQFYATSGAAATARTNVNTGFTMGPTAVSSLNSLPAIPELPAKLKGKTFDYFNQDSFDRSVEDLNEQYKPDQRNTTNYKSKVEQLRKDATINREPVTAAEIQEALKKIEATENRLAAIKASFARVAPAASPTTTPSSTAIDSASIAAKQKEIQAKISTPQVTQTAPSNDAEIRRLNDLEIRRLKAEIEYHKLLAYDDFNYRLPVGTAGSKGINKKPNLLNEIMSRQDKGLSIGETQTKFIGFYKDAIARIEDQFALKIAKLSEQVKTDVPAAPQIQEAIIAEAITPAPTASAVEKAVASATGSKGSRGTRQRRSSASTAATEKVESTTEDVPQTPLLSGGEGGGGGKKGGRRSGGSGGSGGGDGGLVPLFDISKPIPVNVVLPKVLEVKIVASSIKFGESISDRTLASFAKKAQESQGQETSSKEIEAQENKMWAEKEAQDKKILESARKQAADAEKHKEDMLAHQVRMLRLASQLEAAETKLLNDKVKRAEAEAKASQPVQVKQPAQPKQPKEKPLTKADQKFIQDQINATTTESVTKNLSLPFVTQPTGATKSSLLSAAEAAKQNLYFSSIAKENLYSSSRMPSFADSSYSLRDIQSPPTKGFTTSYGGAPTLAQIKSEIAFRKAEENTYSVQDLRNVSSLASRPQKQVDRNKEEFGPLSREQYRSQSFFNDLLGVQETSTRLGTDLLSRGQASRQNAARALDERRAQQARDAEARNQKIQDLTNEQFYKAAYGSPLSVEKNLQGQAIDEAQRISLQEKYSKFAQTSMTREQAMSLARQDLTKKFGSTSALDAAVSYQPNLIIDEATKKQVNEAMKRFNVALTEASNVQDFKNIGQPLVKYLASLIAGSVSINQNIEAVNRSTAILRTLNETELKLSQEQEKLRQKLSSGTGSREDFGNFVRNRSEQFGIERERAVQSAAIRSISAGSADTQSQLLSSSTAVNLNSEITKQEQKLQDQRRKEMLVTKDLTQSTSESVFKLFAMQTALSGITGALNQFGDAAATVGNFLNGTLGSVQSYKQVSNIAKGIRGTKDIFETDKDGNEIKVTAYKGFTDLFKSIGSAYKSASEKSLSEGGDTLSNITSGLRNVFASKEAGGSLSDVFRILGSGLTYAVAGLSSAAVAVTALDAAIIRFNGSIQRGLEITGSFAQINERYNLSLNESQRSVVKRSAESAISTTGIFGGLNETSFGRDIIKSFYSDISDELLKAQVGLDLGKQANQDIINQLGSQLVPQAEGIARGKLQSKDPLKDYTKEIIPPNLIKEELDLLIAAALGEIKNQASTLSYERSRGSESGFGAQEYINQTEFDKLMLTAKTDNDKRVISQNYRSTGQYTPDKNLIPTTVTNYSRSLGESNARDALNSKQILSAFGLSVEIEKQRLNIIQQIAKAQDTISSTEQNKLNIQRDLNSTMEAERTMLDYRVKKLQEEKQTMSELRQSALTSGRKQIDALLDTFGSAFKAQKQPEIETVFQELANAGSQEEQVQVYERLIGIVNKLGAGAKELVDLFKLQLREINAVSAARQIENALQLQNTTYIKQQNFELQRQKDLINASLNARMRMAELDQQKREIGYSTSDMRYQTQQALSNQNPLQKQLSDLFRTFQQESLKNREKLSYDEERNALSNRQNLLNLVLNRTGDLNKVREVANATSPEEALQKATDILNEESASFAKSVTDSAAEFERIIVQAGNQLSLILSGQSSGNAQIDKAKILLNSNSALPQDVPSLLKLIDTTSSLSSGFKEKLDNQGPRLRLAPGTDPFGNASNFTSSLSRNDQLLYQDFVKKLDEKTEAAKKALAEAQGKQVAPTKLTTSDTRGLANQQDFASTERSAQNLVAQFRDLTNIFSTIGSQVTSLEKELGLVRINAAQRALELEKEKLGLSNREANADFSMRNLGMNPILLQQAKTRFDAEQTYKTGIRNYEIDSEKANLNRRQAAFNYLSDKVPLSESKKVLSGEVDPTKAINDYLTSTKNTLSDGVTSAAQEFYRIVTGAGYSLTGKTETAEDAAAQAKNVGSLDLKTLNENRNQIAKGIEDLKTKNSVALTNEEFNNGNAKIEKLTQALSDYDKAINKIKNLSTLKTDLNDKEANALIQNSAGPASDTPRVLGKERRNTLLTSDYQNYLDTEFGGGMTKATTQMDSEMIKFKSTLGETIPMAFRDGMASAFKDLASGDGTKSFSERLMGVANAFLNKINDVLLNNLANQLTAPLTRALTPSSFGGGSAAGYASGGEITQGSGAKDDVPAMLMRGEYVLNQKAVSKYGTRFLDDLNGRKIKKFAAGGAVSPFTPKVDQVGSLYANSDMPSAVDYSGMVFKERSGSEYLDTKSSNYTNINDRLVGNFVFDEKGQLKNVINPKENSMDWTAIEKQNPGLRDYTMKQLQSEYYAKNAQTGENGFYMPGQNGQGAIMGQGNLLGFATQNVNKGEFDKFASSRNSASIDIGVGSQRLSYQALSDKNNPQNREFLDAKQKALELYFGGVEGQKQKATGDYEEQKRYKEEMEAYELAKRTAKRKQYQGILRNLAIQAATAAVSYGVQTAAAGISSANQAGSAAKVDAAIDSGQIEMQTNDLNSSFSDYAATRTDVSMEQAYKDYNYQGAYSKIYSDAGQLSFGEKFLNLKGAWSGGTMPGTDDNRGGLSNFFNAKGTQDFGYIGTKAGVMEWKDGSYAPMSSAAYNQAFPNTPSFGAGSAGIYPMQFDSKRGQWIGGSSMNRYGRFAAGGMVNGNGLGDNVPAMLNGGEFVISRQAAQNIGYNKLSNLNSTGNSGDSGSEMLASKFEEIIEKLNAVGTINITVNSNGKNQSSEEEGSASTNENTQRALARRVKEAVMQVLAEEKRLGGLLR